MNTSNPQTELAATFMNSPNHSIIDKIKLDEDDTIFNQENQEKEIMLDELPNVKTKTNRKKIIILASILLVIVILAIAFKKNSKKLIDLLLDTIKKVDNVDDPLKSIIFIFILLGFQLFFIPM